LPQRKTAWRRARYLLGPVHAWLDRAEVEIRLVCGQTDGRWISGSAIVSSPEPKGQAEGCIMESLCNAVNTHASVVLQEAQESVALKGFADPISVVRLMP
jgi:hypothetical protein